MELLGFVLAGIGAGLMSALFGLGGGLIIVPALVLMFGSAHAVDALFISSVAVAITSATSVASQGAPRVKQLYQETWSMQLGGFATALSAAYLHTKFNRPEFSMWMAFILHFALLLAILFTTKGVDPVETGRYPVKKSGLAGMVIGALSGLAGVGGGTYTVVYSVRVAQQKWRDGVIAAQGMGLAIGTGATLGFFYSHASATASYSSFTAGQYLALLIPSCITAVYCKKFADLLKGNAIRNGIIMSILLGWALVFIRHHYH